MPWRHLDVAPMTGSEVDGAAAFAGGAVFGATVALVLARAIISMVTRRDD